MGAAEKIENLYEVLGVKPKASMKELRHAYHLLAMRWHPDRNPGDRAAEAHFLQIVEAYRILSSVASRHEYDVEHSLSKAKSTKSAARPKVAASARPVRVLSADFVDGLSFRQRWVEALSAVCIAGLVCTFLSTYIKEADEPRAEAIAAMWGIVALFAAAPGSIVGAVFGRTLWDNFPSGFGRFLALIFGALFGGILAGATSGLLVHFVGPMIFGGDLKQATLVCAGGASIAAALVSAGLAPRRIRKR